MDFEVVAEGFPRVRFGRRDAWITTSGTGKLLKRRWPRSGLQLNFNA